MSKRNNQRSVYIPEEEWEVAREVAWRRRMSVSGLICALLRKDALEFKNIGTADPDFAEEPSPSSKGTARGARKP